MILTRPAAAASTAPPAAAWPRDARPRAAYAPRNARLLACEEGMPASALRPAADAGRAWPTMLLAALTPNADATAPMMHHPTAASRRWAATAAAAPETTHLVDSLTQCRAGW